MATIAHLGTGGFWERGQEGTLHALVGEARQDDYGNDHMDWDWDDGGLWVMMGFMAVFWLGLLAVIAWAITTYARRGHDYESSAIEIARRRYARGEISAEDFERIKRDIT